MEQPSTTTDTVSDDKKESGTPSRRRVLILVLAPVAIVLALTAGMRLVSETAHRKEAAEDAQFRKQFLSSIGPPGKDHVRPEARIVSPPRPADAATQAKIEQSVRGQLEKMNAGDFAGALEFSEAHFRQAMTPDHFRQMLQQGFAPLLTMQDVSFQSASVQTNATNKTAQGIIQATIKTKSGEKVNYRYMLVSVDNKWYVYGVIPAYPAMPPGRLMNSTGRPMNQENTNPSFNDL